MIKDPEILVIGGGNAGLCSALAAREHTSRRIVVVEVAPKVLRGGNSRHTRNFRCKHTKKLGQLSGVYDEDEFLEDLLEVTQGSTDLELAKMTIRQSEDCYSWMQSNGVYFQPSLKGTLSLGRTNAFFLGGGKALLNAYYNRAQSLGIEFLYETKAIHLRLGYNKIEQVDGCVFTIAVYFAIKQPEFGIFDLFRFDSFIFHFNFVRFPFPRGKSVQDHVFSGKDREHYNHNFYPNEGEFPMTENIAHEDDFDKGSITLELPGALHEAFSERAGFCGDLLETDHPGADFAVVEEKAHDTLRDFGSTLMAKVAENRDDGARTIERDNKSWYCLPPSRGTFHCLFGKVEYDRSLYRNSTVKNSICPVDEGLGLLAGRMTVPSGKLATRLVAEMPIRNAKDIFDGFVGGSPAVSTWQKLSRMVDWSWRNVSGKALADIRCNEDIPEGAASVVLSLDGVYVLLRPGERPIGITGDDDGCKGNWREASCGTMVLFFRIIQFQFFTLFRQ